MKGPILTFTNSTGKQGGAFTQRMRELKICILGASAKMQSLNIKLLGSGSPKPAHVLCNAILAIIIASQGGRCIVLVAYSINIKSVLLTTSPTSILRISDHQLDNYKPTEQGHWTWDEVQCHRLSSQIRSLGLHLIISKQLLSNYIWSHTMRIELI